MASATRSAQKAICAQITFCASSQEMTIDHHKCSPKGRGIWTRILYAGGRAADPRGIQGLAGIKMDSEKIEETSKARRPGKRASSTERWELARMNAAGVLKAEDHPDFDEGGNVSSTATLEIKWLFCSSMLYFQHNSNKMRFLERQGRRNECTLPSGGGIHRPTSNFNAFFLSFPAGSQ